MFAVPLTAVVSFAATATVSAVTADDLRDHTVGVTGAFNNWGENGDGVWVGTVYVVQ